MRVNLAAQVLSASVASVLKTFGPPVAAGTARLCEMGDQFFDCLNVRSLTEHQRKRQPFLAPCRSVQDERYVYFHGRYEMSHHKTWESKKSSSEKLRTENAKCIISELYISFNDNQLGKITRKKS